MNYRNYLCFNKKVEHTLTKL